MTDPTPTPDAGAPKKRRRRDDIDAIRILTCFSVIFGHAMIVFALGMYYHVKDPAENEWARAIYELRHGWSMPAFFLVAGWSALTAFRAKGPRPFWTNRVRRLLVPFVVGLILLAPLIKWFELKSGFDLRPSGPRTTSGFEMGFIEFFPRYWQRMNLTTWSHLWFLGYLMIVLVLTYPAIARLTRRPRILPEGVVARMLLYLPPFVLGGILILGRGWWPYYPNLIGDLPNFIYFTLLFLAGAVIAADPVAEKAVERERWRLFAVGVVCLLWMTQVHDTDLGRLLAACAAWGIVTGMLGIGSGLTFRRGPVFRYLSDAIMPLFILHNAVIVVAAFYLVPLAMPWPVKFLILFVAGSAVSLLIYQLVIRHVPPMRFLFGAPAGKAGTLRPAQTRVM